MVLSVVLVVAFSFITRTESFISNRGVRISVITWPKCSRIDVARFRIHTPSSVSVSTVVDASVASPTVDVVDRPMFSSLREDFAVSSLTYRKDWMDGVKGWTKTLSAVLLLYFACLAPTVSFGGLCAVLTNGNLGVIEFLVSHGAAGMVYSVLSGQPMTFIAPTGLTMAFMAALYRFSVLTGLPFLPLYGWVGLWTSGLLVLTAVGGFGRFIKYCTTFTDDVFNALLVSKPDS